MARLPDQAWLEDFFGYVRHGDGHVHDPAHDWPLGKSPGHRSKKEVWWNESEVSAQLDKCFPGDPFTAFVKSWIAEGLREKPVQPFFLYLAYDAPHATWPDPSSGWRTSRDLVSGSSWGAILSFGSFLLTESVALEDLEPSLDELLFRKVGHRFLRS